MPDTTPKLRCVCGDPVERWTGPGEAGWIHSPGSDTRCLNARPRCPHCGLPHDLTPGSAPVRLCEKARSPEWQAAVAAGQARRDTAIDTPQHATTPAPVDPALAQRIHPDLAHKTIAGCPMECAEGHTYDGDCLMQAFAQQPTNPCTCPTGLWRRPPLIPNPACPEHGQRDAPASASSPVDPALQQRIARAVRDATTHIADLRNFDTQIAAAVLAELAPELTHAEQAGEMRALLADLTDPDPCWYDHHGYCQAHGWFATEPACPHARAKALAGPAEEAGR